VSILAAPDGAIYGEAARFFRLTATGLTFIYEKVDADGFGSSPLIQGADGALYGTVWDGPSHLGQPESWPLDTFSGGVFRLTIPPLP
jgi:hypothetical protein